MERGCRKGTEMERPKAMRTGRFSGERDTGRERGMDLVRAGRKAVRRSILIEDDGGGWCEAM